VEAASGEEISPPEEEPRSGPEPCGTRERLGREGGLTGGGVLGAGVASGAGGGETAGVFTGGCGVLAGRDGPGGFVVSVTTGGTAVLTTPSTAAFGPATASSKGFAEAPSGAQIKVRAAQTPAPKKTEITLAFAATLDGYYPVSGRIFISPIDLAFRHRM
jgi:hypothetical protein